LGGGFYEGIGLGSEEKVLGLKVGGVGRLEGRVVRVWGLGLEGRVQAIGRA
jgi:hypothetical protein